MKKSILFTLIICQQAIAQPVFKNDSSYSAYGKWVLPELDSVFHLNNNPDFTFRVWIDVYLQMRKQVFILSLKDGKWSARFFVYGWKVKPGTDTLDGKEYLEIKAPEDKIPDLLKGLEKNNYLDIPESETLRDRKGKLAHQYVLDGTFYCFELISANSKRLYSYHCPGVDKKAYPYIKTFKQVLNIIGLVHKYFGLHHSPC